MDSYVSIAVFVNVFPKTESIITLQLLLFFLKHTLIMILIASCPAVLLVNWHEVICALHIA